ncbi:amidohydrolase [Alphaproteobacteria bacterium]|nr:amidohydrolase [Alphaproteobacteria bacterium]
MTTIYEARSILTMNPSQERATHVAVRDGHILAVGQKEDVKNWEEAFGPLEINSDFTDKIIMPGFVEGHSHLMEGLNWNFIYTGYYDREDPNGKIWKGLKSIEDVIARLKEEHEKREDKSAPLIAWGFDPIFFGDRKLNRHDLDIVSTDCAILLFHASLHIINTNSYVIDEVGVDANDNSEFIRRNSNGELTGEFLGQVGMFIAMRATGVNIFASFNDNSVLENFGKICQRAGVTTATDLANNLADDSVAALRMMTDKEDYPVRIVAALAGNALEAQDGIDRLNAISDQQTDKLRMNIVKLIADGSIQGFSARLRWPYYHNGAPNGLWYIDVDKLNTLIHDYNAAGIQIHIHTNGDGAIDAALDAFENALSAHYRPNHRHTLQHCQMADRAHFKRMSQLGLGVNLFSNHIYFWGDAHVSTTMGRDRANRLDDAGGALRAGVPLAIHSDAPVTMMNPLFTAWCAVNRTTSSGDHLGGDIECITVREALETITLGAAYSLKMDHEIGSIEVGKRADFTILDQDPISEGEEKLKDIRVHGTLLGGKIFINEMVS